MVDSNKPLRTWNQFFGFNRGSDDTSIHGATTAGRVLKAVQKTEQKIDRKCKDIDKLFIQSIKKGAAREEIRRLSDKKDLCIELQTITMDKGLWNDQSIILTDSTKSDSVHDSLSQRYGYFS